MIRDCTFCLSFARFFFIVERGDPLKLSRGGVCLGQKVSHFEGLYIIIFSHWMKPRAGPGNRHSSLRKKRLNFSYLIIFLNALKILLMSKYLFNVFNSCQNV